MTAELSIITRPPGRSQGSPHAPPWRSACRGQRRGSAATPRPPGTVKALRATTLTLPSLQPLLAFLQGSPYRLRLGLVRQRCNLGRQRLRLRVLDIHCHGGKIPEEV